MAQGKEQEQSSKTLGQLLDEQGYTLGKSSDELPAWGPGDNFYADHDRYAGQPGGAGLPRSLDADDRDLLRRMLQFLEDDGTLTDKERRVLSEDLGERLDEALSACTDDELTDDEREAQSKGSW